jgi:hypothetical protein
VVKLLSKLEDCEYVLYNVEAAIVGLIVESRTCKHVRQQDGQGQRSRLKIFGDTMQSNWLGVGQTCVTSNRFWYAPAWHDRKALSTVIAKTLHKEDS